MALVGHPVTVGVQVIRKVAKPRMSTYSLLVLAVATVTLSTVMVTARLMPLASVMGDGLTLTERIPVGRTPRESAPPSMLNVTSPSKNVPLLLLVPTTTEVVPVAPVVGIAT